MMWIINKISKLLKEKKHSEKPQQDNDSTIVTVQQQEVEIPKPLVVFDKIEGPPLDVKTISDKKNYKEWRLTYYLIAEQSAFSGPKTVPIFDQTGKTILALVEPAFFSHLALQGSGKLRDGTLLNVSGQYVNVKHSDYSLVLEHHMKKLSKRPLGYSGIASSDGGKTVSSALSFKIVKDVGLGYGKIRGVAHEPFRTLAADIGLTKRSDPQFKGKGGVVPPHTKVHIKEFVGVNLPDGTKHDGWFTVIDTGGGIFGAHFDVFVGTQSLKEKVKIPSIANIWFEGIDERLPENYNYGLHDV